MPRRSVRTRKRTMGVFSFLIGLAVVAAVGLICAIAIRDRLKPVEQETEAPAPTDGFFVDAKNMPETQVVLRSDTFSEEYLPTPTPDPDNTPTPEPTPQPTPDMSDPTAALRPVAMAENLLPIYKKAFTEEKVIAITLDECSGETITAAFVKLAQNYGAKLTLFPTGESIMKSGMNTLLRRCVFELGFEIENRGYSDIARLYQYIDNMMVQEIWKQSVALNFALGVKYQPHFFRMYGGLGENDPRTHAYLKQEGYLGIAHWTTACSGMAISKIPEKLTPGGIYFFKSNQDDGQRMYALMKAAKEQGYRMVTLNELFGLPANEYHQVQGSLLAEKMPVFHYDANQYYDLYVGDAAWAVALVQNRLSQLGYLPEDSADGVFGEGTATGVRLFQAQIGRAASGVADVKTQEALFAIDAPRNPRPLDIPIEEKSDGKSSGKSASDDAAQDGDIYDDFKFSSLMNDSDEDVDFSDVQPETAEPEPDEDEDQGNPFQDNGVEEE